MKRLLCGLLLLLALSGCGYRFGPGCRLCPGTRIGVCVQGDVNGMITAALARRLAFFSPFVYDSCNPAYTIRVRVLCVEDINIGFRYDEDERDLCTDEVVPVEGRKIGTVLVSVCEACSGCRVMGPAKVRAYLDFDHGYHDLDDEINVTSVGQISDITEAQEAACEPWSERIAERIVDYVTACW